MRTAVIVVLLIAVLNIDFSDSRIKLPRRPKKINTLPSYYGWLVRKADSSILTLSAFRLYVALFRNRTLGSEFEKAIKTTRQLPLYTKLPKYMIRRYARSDESRFLSAMFCNKGRVSSCRTYAKQSAVKSSLKKTTYLRVIGFFITPYSMGARIQLSQSQLSLWKSADSLGKTGRSCCHKINQFADRNSTNASSVFRPTSGRGSAAQLTIATALAVTPATSARNLVDIIDCEGKCVRSGSYRRVTGKDINGKVRYYDYGRFVLYLDKPLLVKSTFVALNAAHSTFVSLLGTVLLVVGAVMYI